MGHWWGTYRQQTALYLPPNNNQFHPFVSRALYGYHRLQNRATDRQRIEIANIERGGRKGVIADRKRFLTIGKAKFDALRISGHGLAF